MARSKKTRRPAPLDRVLVALDSPAWLSTVLPGLLRGESEMKDDAKAMDVRRTFAQEFDAWDRQRLETLALVRTLLARRDEEAGPTMKKLG